MYRSNYPATTPEIYFKRSVGIPFLDGVITELHERFSDLTVEASRLLYLVPTAIIREDFSMDKLEGAIKHYRFVGLFLKIFILTFFIIFRDDLPSVDNIETEISLWRRRFGLLRIQQKKQILFKFLGGKHVNWRKYRQL